MPTGSPPNLIPSLPVPGSHPPGVESHHLWPPPVSVSQDLSHNCQEAPLLLLRGEELFTTGLPQGWHQAPGNRVCSPSHRSGKSSLHSHSWPACLWFQSRPAFLKTPRIPPALAPIPSRRECCLLPALKARVRERWLLERNKGTPPLSPTQSRR